MIRPILTAAMLVLAQGIDPGFGIPGYNQGFEPPPPSPGFGIIIGPGSGGVMTIPGDPNPGMIWSWPQPGSCFVSTTSGTLEQIPCLDPPAGSFRVPR